MNVREMLNPELGVVDMPSEWWEEHVCALLIMERGILMAALRHVPDARDCYKIGLAHGQCVQVSGKSHPITAIMKAMRKRVGERMAGMNGCNLYTQSWDSKMAKACAFVGIKKIYYAEGSPIPNEVKEFKACGVEVTRVSL